MRSGTSGSPRVRGSRASGPAITWSMIAASMASRASGPAWSRVNDSGMTPCRETRPIVGFSPVRFCWLDGSTIEPPVWVPMEEDASRAATAQAGPVEEPPGSTDGSSGVHALTVVTVPFGVVARVVASGPICPFPRRIPPACRSRATAVASSSGTKSSKMKELQRVGTPSVK